MSTISFVASKGGQGTSTIAAAFALHLSKIAHVTLSDTITQGDTRDLPAIVGVADQDMVEVADNLVLMSSTTYRNLDGTNAYMGHEVVDHGEVRTRPATDRVYLVIRADYVALRRFVVAQFPIDGVVLVTEQARALSAQDVERTVGAPVIANVPVDPVIARAIDAGLLASRMPQVLRAPMDRLMMHALAAATV